MYNFRNSKANIINILRSKTPIETKESIPSDNEFTYENGIVSWVSAIFVDIKNSSELFASKDEKLARLLRAFTSEIITIFQESDNYRQIGIRGDCVYGIYSTPQKTDVDDVFNIAVLTNTFLKMFNEILKNEHYTTIGAGIGLGCDEELIIKAGRSGTGINDKIWIGKAVVDASNLSSVAKRHGFDNIAMNSCFYSNIIDIEKKLNPQSQNWIKKVQYYGQYFYEPFYQCDMVRTDFNDWINGGMK